MRIEISSKLCPFSHEPGTAIPIPLTSWEVRVFPALLRFKNRLSAEEYELVLPHKGPVKGFTAQLDLERAHVCIYGHAEEGYFCSHIKRHENQLLFDGAALPFTLEPFSAPTQLERLSLGAHKSQDWQLMMRRLDPTELWPFWLRLSELTPPAIVHQVGSYALLAVCAMGDKVDQVSLWKKVFMGCIEGILAPRLVDEKHQGLFPEDPQAVVSAPLGLLHVGAELIRSLFFKEERGEIALLPNLPPECHAGRYIGLKTAAGDRFDLEWSKKSLKKAIIYPAHTGELKLRLQKGIETFRLRHSLKERGKKVTKGSVLACEAGKVLFLDRFVR